MLVDGNLLIYAVDSDSNFHRPAEQWLTSALNGSARVGFPWASLTAFLRLVTNARVTRAPMTAAEAWAHVEDWLGADPAWVPLPTERHAAVLGGLVRRHDVRGGLIADADLAALAIEHGLTVCSNDSDFARFPEVRWHNPLA